MAEAFRVDPEALADAVAEMVEFQRFAEAVRSEIESMVDSLHLSWSGQAAAAHAAAHRQWCEGEALMREALDRLHVAGNAAQANYRGAMSRNLEMWS